MMDVPDDIRSTAVRVYSQYTADMASWSLVDLISEAIMAEREKAAKIADAHSECERDCGDVIAFAIRRGTP